VLRRPHQDKRPVRFRRLRVTSQHQESCCIRGYWEQWNIMPISGLGSIVPNTPKCAGRCRRTTAEEEIARQFKIPIPPQLDLPISYNIAPTQNILTVRRNPETGERTLDALRWGLIPNWAKDKKLGHKMINSRAETVDTAIPLLLIGAPLKSAGV
jgi:hypothetical protein